MGLQYCLRICSILSFDIPWTTHVKQEKFHYAISVCVWGGGIHTHVMYWINVTGRPCIPLVWSCTAACLGCLCLSSQVTVSDMLDLLLIFDEYSSGKFHQEHIQLAFKYVTFKRYDSSTHAHFAAVLFLNVFRDNGKWKRQSISSMSVFPLFVSQWSICNDYL